MKKLAVLISIVTMVLCVAGVNEVFALDLGQEITIYDLVSSSETGWYGQQEDQETEPGTVQHQLWDLEAFFLKGTTLSMVGGYDFINGKDGYESGDIFIDVDGDAQYGPVNDGTGYNNTFVSNTFGYDYVLDLDFANPEGLMYYIYAIDENATVQTTTVYFNINQEANPWQYDSGGELFGSGTINYQTGLKDDELGLLGGTHNVLSVDLGFLKADINNFTVHFTMECGNDNLMGQNYDPIPEPSTVLLLGIGLLGVVGIGRQRIKK